MLQNYKKSKEGQKGFTIVELLIVIVVIAILAAITIVAYNGVTSSARASAALANAKSVKSVADTAQSELGSYPAVGANSAATLANLNAGQYAKIPSAINIVSGAAITAGTTNVLYAVKGSTGACFGYFPVGGTFQAIYSGDATALTNVASPVCS